MDYWREAFMAALEEAEIPFPSDEKLKLGADVLEGAHENFGTAHGYDCIPNPQTGEIEKLNRELRRERAKIHCHTCDGRGRIETPGPYHSSNSQCWKCNGEGRVDP